MSQSLKEGLLVVRAASLGKKAGMGGGTGWTKFVQDPAAYTIKGVCFPTAVSKFLSNPPKQG